MRKLSRIDYDIPFQKWVHKFKIDKIPLAEEEWEWIRKGFCELYDVKLATGKTQK